MEVRHALEIAGDVDYVMSRGEIDRAARNGMDGRLLARLIGLRVEERYTPGGGSNAKWLDLHGAIVHVALGAPVCPEGP